MGLEPDELEKITTGLREHGVDDETALAAIDLIFRGSQEWPNVLYSSLGHNAGVEFMFDSAAFRQCAEYLSEGSKNAMLGSLFESVGVKAGKSAMAGLQELMTGYLLAASIGLNGLAYLLALVDAIAPEGTDLRPDESLRAKMVNDAMRTAHKVAASTKLRRESRSEGWRAPRGD